MPREFWCKAGPEFGSEAGKIFIITKALYGLKSSGAAFRLFLADHLHDKGFRASLADPDVWMRPAVRDNSFKYWEYVLCYVDDILAISDNPHKLLSGVQLKFKLKDDKMEEPEMYLGADLSKMNNEDGDECWAMSSENIVQRW